MQNLKPVHLLEHFILNQLRSEVRKAIIHFYIFFLV